MDAMGLIEQIYEWIVLNSLTADLSNLLLKACEKELDTYRILSINVVLVVYIYMYMYIIYTMHPDHYLTKSKKHKSMKEHGMIQS